MFTNLTHTHLAGKASVGPNPKVTDTANPRMLLNNMWLKACGSSGRSREGVGRVLDWGLGEESETSRERADARATFQSEPHPEDVVNHGARQRRSGGRCHSRRCSQRVGRLLSAGGTICKRSRATQPLSTKAEPSSVCERRRGKRAAPEVGLREARAPRQVLL